MRLYYAPILWLIMGVLVLASQAYTGSSRFRARVSSERLAAVQKANSQRFMTVAVFGVGLFCTYTAIRTLVGGVEPGGCGSWPRRHSSESSRSGVRVASNQLVARPGLT